MVVRWRSDRGLDAWLVSVCVDKRQKCQLSPLRIVQLPCEADEKTDIDQNAIAVDVMTHVAKEFCSKYLEIEDLLPLRDKYMKDTHNCEAPNELENTTAEY